MPTVDLTDDEHAALAAAIRSLIEEDRFPLSPRLDPLRPSPPGRQPHQMCRLAR
jgi:hypothetical protein